MEIEGKNLESATVSIAWLVSERDKKGKGEEIGEKTDGLRNAGFGDDVVQNPLRFLKSAHSNHNFTRIS